MTNTTIYVFTAIQELALDAVQTVSRDVGGGQREVDIKNYAKVEKIPGGTIEDCKVILQYQSAASCCLSVRGSSILVSKWLIPLTSLRACKIA